MVLILDQLFLKSAFLLSKLLLDQLKSLTVLAVVLLDEEVEFL